MQWGQIKTLFILCFFVLDIFLIRQFLTTQEFEISFIPETSIEEGLKTDIEGLDLLSEEAMEASYLYASRKELSEEELETLEQFDNQEIEVLSGGLIISQFEDPITLNDDNSPSDLVKSNVLNGDSYVYWGENEPTNTLIFFQRIEDKPIYYNQGGMILVFLNESGEIVQYMQTMLSNEDDQQDDYPLITDKEAVLHLYNNTNELMQSDELTDRTLGYQNLTSLPNGGQVLAPTWKITINGNRNYFIHAVEGITYPRDDKSFLRETINDGLGIIQESNSDSPLISDIREQLTKIMESTVWSGEE